MKKILKISLLLIFFLLNHLLISQTILGQYEDEAPLQTWNILGYTSARAIGMGGIRFALSHDGSAAVVNPALASLGPDFQVSLSGSIRSATLFRFSLINTGPIHTSRNSNISLYTLDHIVISGRLQKWGFVLSAGYLENYHRPSVIAEDSIQNQVYHDIRFEQTGTLPSISLSLSRLIAKRLSIGLGINYFKGQWSKKTQENWYPGISITDEKTHDSSGFIVHGGLAFKISPQTSIGAVFRAPFEKKTESENLLEFRAEQINKTITIQTFSDNTFKQPFIAGLGGVHAFSDRLLFGLDVSFFQWSRYQIQYFGEDIERNFKDTIKIRAGLEYMIDANFFEQTFHLPLRMGIMYDPQPMSDPASSYVFLTLGSGLHSRRFKFDTGIALGREFGSGQNLVSMTFLATIMYEISNQR